MFLTCHILSNIHRDFHKNGYPCSKQESIAVKSEFDNCFLENMFEIFINNINLLRLKIGLKSTTNSIIFFSYRKRLIAKFIEKGLAFQNVCSYNITYRGDDHETTSFNRQYY